MQKIKIKKDKNHKRRSVDLSLPPLVLRDFVAAPLRP